MKCKFILRQHTFNSEVELDDFLLSKEQYYSKYGDLVFDLSEAQLKADTLIEKCKKQA